MDKQNQRRVLKTRVRIEKGVNTNNIWALKSMWNVPNRFMQRIFETRIGMEEQSKVTETVVPALK